MDNEMNTMDNAQEEKSKGFWGKAQEAKKRAQEMVPLGSGNAFTINMTPRMTKRNVTRRDKTK